MRGCGLKCIGLPDNAHDVRVILYARMWIEMYSGMDVTVCMRVILYARMWIEIAAGSNIANIARSSSMRGCGLK